MKLKIPPPIPLHACFRNVRGRGRVKTDRYHTWQRNAGNEVLAQKRETFDGDCVFALTVVRPDKRKRDLDNLLKSSIDLMVYCGIVKDDQQFIKVSAQWGDENCVEVYAA